MTGAARASRPAGHSRRAGVGRRLRRRRRLGVSGHRCRRRRRDGAGRAAARRPTPTHRPRRDRRARPRARPTSRPRADGLVEHAGRPDVRRCSTDLLPRARSSRRSGSRPESDVRPGEPARGWVARLPRRRRIDGPEQHRGAALLARLAGGRRGLRAPRSTPPRARPMWRRPSPGRRQLITCPGNLDAPDSCERAPRSGGERRRPDGRGPLRRPGRSADVTPGPRRRHRLPSPPPTPPTRSGVAARTSRAPTSRP